MKELPTPSVYRQCFFLICVNGDWQRLPRPRLDGTEQCLQLPRFPENVKLHAKQDSVAFYV